MIQYQAIPTRVTINKMGVIVLFTRRNVENIPKETNWRGGALSWKQVETYDFRGSILSPLIATFIERAFSCTISFPLLSYDPFVILDN